MRRLSQLAVAAVLTLVFSSSAGAPAATPVGGEDSPKATVGSYMSGGGLWGNLDDFNDALRARGCPGVKDYAYSVGFGGYGLRKRLLLGLELRGIAWRPTESRNLRTELYGFNGFVNVGVNVLPKSKMILYPYAGVGTGRLYLRLRAIETTFGNVVAAGTANNLFLKQRTVMIQGGIGGDFRVPARHRKNKSHTIGFRVGYAHDIGKSARNWEVDDVEVHGGPSATMSGVYGQITLGRSATGPRKHFIHCKKKGCCENKEDKSVEQPATEQ